MQRLVNAMTVNETYFFREDYQFDALISGILPELAVNKKPGDTIRIWSLPCSTGEEPYSIAIYILEGWDRADDFNIEIIASDINSQVLSQAHEGIYGERALSRIPPDIRTEVLFARCGRLLSDLGGAARIYRLLCSQRGRCRADA